MKIIVLILLIGIGFSQDILGQSVKIWGTYFDKDNPQNELEIMKNGNFIYNYRYPGGLRTEIGRWKSVNDTLCFSCEMDRDKIIYNIIPKSIAYSKFQLLLFERDDFSDSNKEALSDKDNIKILDTKGNEYYISDSNFIFLPDDISGVIRLKFKHLTDTIFINSEHQVYEILLNDLETIGKNTLKHSQWMIYRDKIVPLIYDEYLDFKPLYKK